MKNENVITLEKPEENEDVLTRMLRQGAKDLLANAVQAELTVGFHDHGTPVSQKHSPPGFPARVMLFSLR